MMNMNRAVNAQGSTRQHIPIAAVVPYRKDYAFKGRVIEKSEPRTWNNDKGQGTLFTIVFMDGNGDTMQGKFFTAGYEKFYTLVTEGKVYEFADGRVQVQQRRSGTTSEYDITFDASSNIQELPDDSSIPLYSTKKLASLESIPTEKDVADTRDYMGIVVSSKPLSQFTTKAGKASQRRDFQIVDRAGLVVDVTLWGDQASPYQDSQFDGNPAIIVHAVKINEFNGSRSLSSSFNTTCNFNASDNKAQNLKTWYAKANKDDFKVLKQLQSSAGQGGAGGAGKRVWSRDRLGDLGDEATYIQSMQDQGKTGPNDGEWLTIDGYITRIQFSPSSDGAAPQRKPWYEACPNDIGDGRKCAKKVIHSGMMYSCERCGKEFQQCEYRWVLSASIADEDALKWVSFFDQEAIAVLGKTAGECNDMLTEDPSGNSLSAFFDTFVNKPIHLTVRVNLDFGREVAAVRYRAFKVEEITKTHHLRIADYSIAEINYLRELRANKQ